MRVFHMFQWLLKHHPGYNSNLHYCYNSNCHYRHLHHYRHNITSWIAYNYVCSWDVIFASRGSRRVVSELGLWPRFAFAKGECFLHRKGHFLDSLSILLKKTVLIVAFASHVFRSFFLCHRQPIWFLPDAQMPALAENDGDQPDGIEALPKIKTFEPDRQKIQMYQCKLNQFWLVKPSNFFHTLETKRENSRSCRVLFKFD